ncbi:hypothetical protein C8R44DRAFT_757849 [Mycena epipterygia]|nr:hypothetical protein C8R44DRAFT_757849 [Mycena epipterygia]
MTVRLYYHAWRALQILASGLLVILSGHQNGQWCIWHMQKENRTNEHFTRHFNFWEMSCSHVEIWIQQAVFSQ